MIGYVTLGTADIARGAVFYDAVAKVLGFGRMMDEETFIAWGDFEGPGAGLSITKPFDCAAASVGNGTGNKEDGVFWGMGVGVAEFMSFSVSGTENQVNAGVGLRIPGVDGLNITVGQYDVSNKHKRTQTAISVSYSIRFGG